MQGIYLSASVLRSLAVLAIFVAMSLPAGAQNDADKAIRADYDATMKILESISADANDEEKRAKMSEFQQAVRAFVDKHKAKSAELTVGHYDLARAYIHIADPEAVVAEIGAFMKACPGHADTEDALMLLGDSYRAANKTTEALALYQAFIKDYPKSDKIPFARLGLATALLFNLDFDGAINEFTGLRAAFPEHQVNGDAALQLVEAYVDSGRAEEAKAMVKALLEQQKDAPELQRLDRVLHRYGTKAPDLVGIEKWVGAQGANVSRLQGRVVVLCFFTNWSLHCTRELVLLSELEQQFGAQGLTVWGVTKAYKQKKEGQASGLTLDEEAAWLGRYRDNPRFVLQKELGVSTKDAEKKDLPEAAEWKEYERPISVSFALGTNFDNHKAYDVRGVPYLIVIDKKGVIRYIREGGSVRGGFPNRVLSKIVQRLLAE